MGTAEEILSLLSQVSEKRVVTASTEKILSLLPQIYEKLWKNEPQNGGFLRAG